MGQYRRFFSLLPSDPRCASCLAPFEGIGAAFARMVFNKKRAQTNPLFCTTCEECAKRTHAGAETALRMLFADIRSSTPLVESMGDLIFKELMDRFYTETTRVLTHSFGLIDILTGDEVSGFYLPGFVGRNFAIDSVSAAKEILRVTGHEDPEGPCAPVGVGINTG